MYRWLPIIFGCHCRADRSFIIRGRKFPICARCTGELAGILSVLVSVWFFMPSLTTCLILMVPMLVDGFVQRLTRYESTNARRVITGYLFGMALAYILVITSADAIHLGMSIGERLKQ